MALVSLIGPRQRTPAREVLSAEMFASGADQFLVIHGNARVELPRMAPVHYLRRVRAPGLAYHERIAPRRGPIHLHGVRRHLPALAPTELDAARLVRLHARVEHILGQMVVAHAASGHSRTRTAGGKLWKFLKVGQ